MGTVQQTPLSDDHSKESKVSVTICALSTEDDFRHPHRLVAEFVGHIQRFR